MDDNNIDFKTVATFNASFEPQLAIAKSMLDEAGIKYYVTNENYLSTQPLTVAPSPMSIELRVETGRFSEAFKILESLSQH